MQEIVKGYYLKTMDTFFYRYKCLIFTCSSEIRKYLSTVDKVLVFILPTPSIFINQEIEPNEKLRIMNRKHAICVSTSKPTTSLTPGGGGGAVTFLCPHSGSILSSLRVASDSSGKSLLGIKSISLFPSQFGSQGTSLILAYGSTLSKHDDTYGILLTLKNVSSPPTVNWKCRLPEAILSAGLLVSPCGYYIIGGGESGNLHIWTSLGGSLLRTIKAHYRPIRSMIWSDCSSYLITGGDDGMVHAFSLLDLVEYDANPAMTVPVRSWSAHHLPVTSLFALGDMRLASASEDGQLVLMELSSSETTLAKIQLSTGVTCLTSYNGSLYGGSNQGTIYAIDLTVYAAYRTAHLGLMIKRRKVSASTSEEKVLEYDSNDSFQSELRGHESSVSALSVAVLEDSITYLVSGDLLGTVRIWDLDNLGFCVRVILPWSFSVRTSMLSTDDGTTASRNDRSTAHPITSITIIPYGDEGQTDSLPEGGMFLGNNTSSKETKANSVTNLLTPLKRFPDTTSDSSQISTWAPVPFLQPKRDSSSLAHTAFLE
jgi:WD40 repeat protein